MVHTISSRTSRVVLAGFGIGALAAGVATAALTGAPAHAQTGTSSAYGVSATGVEGKAAQPSVSSSGEDKTATGSVSGMGWSATGITVKAGAGYAEAVVGDITVAGRSLGGASATCRDGAVTYSSPAAVDDGKLRVLPQSGGAAAVVQILGAGDEPVQTITVAVAQCAKGVPPTTTVPPTTQPPTTQPPVTTGPPTGTGTPTGTGRPTSTSRPAERPIQPAPVPEIKTGHHAVTG